MHTMACPRHGRRSMAKIKANSLPSQRGLWTKTLHGSTHGRHVLFFEERERRKGEKKRDHEQRKNKKGSSLDENDRGKFEVGESYPKISDVFSYKKSGFRYRVLEEFLWIISLTITEIALSKSPWKDTRNAEQIFVYISGMKSSKGIKLISPSLTENCDKKSMMEL